MAQVSRGINAPLTSSAGRLFDGVAALIGLRNQIDYEAQAAVELEMAARGADPSGPPYPFELSQEGGKQVVRLGGLFSALLGELRAGTPQAEMSARFHRTVATIIAESCRHFSRKTGVQRVVLSGGVFQNRLLLGLTRGYLEQRGLGVFTHKEIPCNDGGISLGQAVIAHFRNLG